MDNKFEQLKNQAKEIQMTESEKFLMREKIQETMEYYPLREVLPTSQKVSSPFNFILFTRSVAFVLVGFIAGGGGLAFASEQSLPGDILYTFKTDVNEEIVARLQSTPEAKIAWEEKRIARRSNEGLLLSNKGNLKEKEINIIKEKLEQSNNQIDRQILVLSEDLSFNGITFSSYVKTLESTTSTINNQPEEIYPEEVRLTPSRDEKNPEKTPESFSITNDTESSQKPILAKEFIKTEDVPLEISSSLPLKKEVLSEKDFSSEVLIKFTEEIHSRKLGGVVTDEEFDNLMMLINQATEAQQEKNIKLFYQSIRAIKHILEN